MTKAQLLEHADSMELTKWFAYFTVKSEREQEVQEAAKWRAGIEAGR